MAIPSSDGNALPLQKALSSSVIHVIILTQHNGTTENHCGRRGCEEWQSDMDSNHD